MKTEYLSDEECRARLEDLYSGNAVVLPVSIDHAKYMRTMSQHYIDVCHQETIDLLKADYGQ